MIELRQITKNFRTGGTDEVTALKDVTLQIENGEFVVLVGANGSGKTTLLNIISGVHRPQKGKILIDGSEVTRLPEYKRARWIARVFQNPFYGTAPDLTILDNFRLAALRSQTKRLSIGINSRFRKLVQEKIAGLDMGLEHKLDQPIGQLSGGQRQALTLLMCTMDRTSVLLLDEPTAALDPKSARIVLSLADRLIRDLGLTALLVTHNLKDALQFGSRLIQMHEGRIERDLSHSEKERLQLTDMLDWFE